MIYGVEKSKFNRRLLLPWFTDKKKRWYNSREIGEISKEMVEIFEAVPYLSSIHNFDFDSMKIKLYLVTSDMDLCLDHNIDLAKRWRGDVSILVLDNQLIHGKLIVIQ